MTSVKLRLPQEVIDQLDIPYEGERGVPGVNLAIEGVNLAASVVTLAALRLRAHTFVAALRRWRLRQPSPSIILVAKSSQLDLRIELPRNVSTRQLLAQLEPLLAVPPDSDGR